MLLDDYPAATALLKDCRPGTADDVVHSGRREVRDAICARHYRRVGGEHIDVHRRPFPFRIAHVLADVSPERFDPLLELRSRRSYHTTTRRNDPAAVRIETHEVLDRVGLRQIVSVDDEMLERVGDRFLL